MMRLLAQFWRLCLLRANPQDLPASVTLELLALAAYVGVGTLDANVQLALWNAFLASAVDAFVLVALTHIALWIRDVPGRAVQTITALAGAGAVLGLIAFPILGALHSDEGALVVLQGLLWLLFVSWQILVYGHILRHALDLPLLAGVMVSLVYFYISFKVMNALFLQAG